MSDCSCHPVAMPVSGYRSRQGGGRGMQTERTLRSTVKTNEQSPQFSPRNSALTSSPSSTLPSTPPDPRPYSKQQGQQQFKQLILSRADFFKTLKHPGQELVPVQHPVLWVQGWEEDSFGPETLRDKADKVNNGIKRTTTRARWQADPVLYQHSVSLGSIQCPA